jgi:hypothetical protein
MHPRPRLTQPEREFLEAWMWDEAHVQEISAGAAKKLQVESNPYAAPLLADIASATMSAEEQIAVVNGVKPRSVSCWPWQSEEEFRARHREARAWLDHSRSRVIGPS